MKEDSPLCIPGISSIIYARKELLDIERSYVYHRLLVLGNR